MRIILISKIGYRNILAYNMAYPYVKVDNTNWILKCIGGIEMRC